MLDFLFRRLTAEPPRGAALFESVTSIARQPHWYVEGAVPDSLDGRFAVLATVTALVLVRLEADGADGDAASVALTERFATGRLKARDLVRVIAAGLRGAGQAVSDDEVAAMEVEGGAQGYVRIAAELLAATFGE